MSKYVILGAGLSGLSASYHLGHENCEIFEKNNFLGGHIYSEISDGYTWDQGPHVSFTKHEYVKDLFAASVDQEFLEYNVNIASYFRNTWVPHPAQCNLYAIPQPIRDICLRDFLDSRNQRDNVVINNYEDWLIAAFGKTFYDFFPRAYTRKYWTVEPSRLTTDWVGERVFYPNIEEVKNGYIKQPEFQSHYISKVRYPQNGGYNAFSSILKLNANTNLEHELHSISFKEKKMLFRNGVTRYYNSLINTIPLPELINKSDAPWEIKEAAKILTCSSVLLINVTANHPSCLCYNWMYVYDEDKFSTRINCVEKLSPNNAPLNQTGIQVEVYFSKYKVKLLDDKEIASKVMDELVEMGVLIGKEYVIDCKTKWVQWANVIFDFDRRNALDSILDYLEQFGLIRDSQDLLPMTDWTNLSKPKGTIQMLGRYAEWKYLWTDDCILGGKFCSEM